MQFERSGGVKRGDRADTGDEQARPPVGISQAGSGVTGGDNDAKTANPTADPSSLEDAGTFQDASLTNPGGNGDLEDLTIHDATDPNLGLTDTDDVAPDDWAANTGVTRTAEAGSHGVSRELVDDDRDFTGRKIEFDRPGAKHPKS